MGDDDKDKKGTQGGSDDQGGDDKGQQGGTPAVPATYDDWFKGQPKDVQEMLNGHEHGMKSALETERGDRKQLEKDLRDAASKAEGAEKEAYTKFADQLAEANTKADFFADAHAAGVDDVRLAWAAIREYDLTDRAGRPDLAALKEKCPGLFRETKPVKPPVRTHGGAGTGGKQTTAKSMDDVIRQSAGRQ